MAERLKVYAGVSRECELRSPALTLVAENITNPAVVCTVFSDKYINAVVFLDVPMVKFDE